MERPQVLALFLVVAILVIPFVSFSQSANLLERQLNDQLNQITSKIVSHRKELENLMTKNRSLEEEIRFIEAKIETVTLQAEATSLVVKDLQYHASLLESEISLLTESINTTKHTLARNINELYLLEKRSLIEVIFSEDGFSDFFDRIQHVRHIQEGVGSWLDKLSLEKAELDEREQELNERLFAQERLLALQDLQTQELASNRRTKAALIAKNILQSTSLEEETGVLEETARQIRNRLYVLGSLTPSLALGEAYEKASAVASKVGINPAFLMAILKVESDLGNNLGGGHWQRDMHPRDREAFLQITTKLKLDPNVMPVSSKPRYGWGGAMGPAQFLPSTWLAYEERIVQLSGNNPPNPWRLEDAFAAAALKLAAGGANKKTIEGEREAAMKYFAGGNWKNPAYSFYGDKVLEIKELISIQL